MCYKKIFCYSYTFSLLYWPRLQWHRNSHREKVTSTNCNFFKLNSSYKLFPMKMPMQKELGSETKGTTLLAYQNKRLVLFNYKNLIRTSAPRTLGSRIRVLPEKEFTQLKNMSFFTPRRMGFACKVLNILEFSSRYYQEIHLPSVHLKNIKEALKTVLFWWKTSQVKFSYCYEFEENEINFFIPFSWVFSKLMGSHSERLWLDALKVEEKKEQFKELFFTLQKAFYPHLHLKKPIKNSQSDLIGLERLFFDKASLLRLIRILLNSYNGDFLKKIDKKNLFIFLKNLLNLILQDSSYFYLNKLFEPLEITHDQYVLLGNKKIFLTKIKKAETFISQVEKLNFAYRLDNNNNTKNFNHQGFVGSIFLSCFLTLSSFLGFNFINNSLINELNATSNQEVLQPSTHTIFPISATPNQQTSQPSNPQKLLKNTHFIKKTSFYKKPNLKNSILASAFYSVHLKNYAVKTQENDSLLAKFFRTLAYAIRMQGQIHLSWPPGQNLPSVRFSKGPATRLTTRGNVSMRAFLRSNLYMAPPPKNAKRILYTCIHENVPTPIAGGNNTGTIQAQLHRTYMNQPGSASTVQPLVIDFAWIPGQKQTFKLVLSINNVPLYEWFIQSTDMGYTQDNFRVRNTYSTLVFLDANGNYNPQVNACINHIDRDTFVTSIEKLLPNIINDVQKVSRLTINRQVSINTIVRHECGHIFTYKMTKVFKVDTKRNNQLTVLAHSSQNGKEGFDCAELTFLMYPSAVDLLDVLMIPLSDQLVLEKHLYPEIAKYYTPTPTPGRQRPSMAGRPSRPNDNPVGLTVSAQLTLFTFRTTKGVFVSTIDEKVSNLLTLKILEKTDSSSSALINGCFDKIVLLAAQMWHLAENLESLESYGSEQIKPLTNIHFFNPQQFEFGDDKGELYKIARTIASSMPNKKQTDPNTKYETKEMQSIMEAINNLSTVFLPATEISLIGVSNYERLLTTLIAPIVGVPSTDLATYRQQTKAEIFTELQTPSLSSLNSNASFITYSKGYFKNFLNETISDSVEGYIKSILKKKNAISRTIECFERVVFNLDLILDQQWYPTHEQTLNSTDIMTQSERDKLTHLVSWLNNAITELQKIQKKILQLQTAYTIIKKPQRSTVYLDLTHAQLLSFRKKNASSADLAQIKSLVNGLFKKQTTTNIMEKAYPALINGNSNVSTDWTRNLSYANANFMVPLVNKGVPVPDDRPFFRTVFENRVDYSK